MATAERTIGRCTCPVCSSQRASLRVSASGLAYVVCNACNLQAFARSDNSDTRLRALLIERAGQAPAPEPAGAPAAPADPPAQPAPAPGAVSDSPLWGLMGWK